MGGVIITPEEIEAARKAMGPPDPTPLPTLPAVPAFDLELLPESLRAFVADVTDRQGCPVDFVAIGAMVSLSGAVGRRRKIAAKLHDDWSVVPNLWGMAIGRPSSMKSPALAAATSPLHEIERDASLAYEQAKQEYGIDEQLHKLTAKAAEKTAGAKINSDYSGARAALQHVAEQAPVEPKRKRLIVNDASVEKLQELMADNDMGLVLVRDELPGWLQKLESEDFAEARSFVLTAYTGREAFTVDRIGRGTVHIPAACLSIIGGIQPAKVARIIRGAVTGASDDGLLQRFQLVTWPDDFGTWEWRDRKPHQAAKEAYSNTFHALHGLEYQDAPLRQSVAAQELFRDWQTDHQKSIRAGGLHTAIESHLLKMPEAVLSIALLCELADNPAAELVGDAAMLRALAWSDYLRGHVSRLYHTASSPEVEAARIILRKRDELADGFTAREVGRKGWTGIESAQVATDALELLTDLHHLHIVSEQTGGRPTDRFYWNTGEGGA